MFIWPLTLISRVLVETFVSAGAGSTIGDMTDGGGLAAAFDTTTSQAYASSASSHPTTRATHWCGKDWGSGVSKTICRFTVYGPNDIGFSGNAGNTYTIELRGSNSAPSAATDGTLLATVSSIPYALDSVVDKTSGIDTSAAYRYHWIRLTPNSSHYGFIAEIKFYELA